MFETELRLALNSPMRLPGIGDNCPCLGQETPTPRNRPTHFACAEGTQLESLGSPNQKSRDCIERRIPNTAGINNIAAAR